MHRQSPRPERPRGFALVAVLWSLVLLALIVMHLGQLGRGETGLARNITAAARAEALAEAGIEEAIFHLSHPVPASRWDADGTTYRLLLDGGEVTAAATDEAGKINPNTAPKELLTGLFLALEMPPEAASDLAEAISTAVKTGALETLDELSLIPGMNSALLARIRPYLSIYTAAERPDPEKASPVVRRALGVTRLSQAQPHPQGPLVATIEAKARTEEGAVFVREAVLRRDPGQSGPGRIVYWGRKDDSSRD